jgi:hypothetical protein
MIVMPKSKNFGNFSKLILALLPNHDLILMVYSPIKKSYKILEVTKQLFQRSKHI